ncbi:NUDIX hydrolase [Trichloromonas sp.]|uniref:NUDIX hydrolase n=1 Tax=Trichloromonas sp. TaxID=3069249 RepID=UPI002A3CCAE4|nr:CoA pyrophosphatase [Trichloromonas sp.]
MPQPLLSSWPDQLTHFRRALNPHPPRMTSGPEHGHGAVALILRPGPQGAEILYIERAAHPRDPWSGDLAFPGGRIDPEDGGIRQAAERETYEEIGLDLRDADYLGGLDDIVGAHLPVRVSCCVYALPEGKNPPLRRNHEVSDVFYMPLDKLRAPARHIITRIDWNRAPRETPALTLLPGNRPLLWGITYRLTTQLLNRIGLPLLPPNVVSAG